MSSTRHKTTIIISLLIVTTFVSCAWKESTIGPLDDPTGKNISTANTRKEIVFKNKVISSYRTDTVKNISTNAEILIKIRPFMEDYYDFPPIRQFLMNKKESFCFKVIHKKSDLQIKVNDLRTYKKYAKSLGCGTIPKPRFPFIRPRLDDLPTPRPVETPVIIPPISIGQCFPCVVKIQDYTIRQRPFKLSKHLDQNRIAIKLGPGKYPLTYFMSDNFEPIIERDERNDKIKSITIKLSLDKKLLEQFGNKISFVVSKEEDAGSVDVGLQHIDDYCSNQLTFFEKYSIAINTSTKRYFFVDVTKITRQ